MIMFRTWYDTRIEEIEVVHETAHYVTIQETPQWTRRDAKRSDNGMNYFSTWQDAHAFLIAREQAAIDKAIAKMLVHQETLEKIMVMVDE